MIKYVFLTPQFYYDYRECKEIEHKVVRPYIQINIRINNVPFAIPLRSNISHKDHVLWTDKANNCGVDFTKSVIITDEEKYINTSTKPHIRQNEFNYLRDKSFIIQQGMERYIRAYKKPRKLHLFLEIMIY